MATVAAPAAAQSQRRSHCISRPTLERDATFKGSTAAEITNNCPVPVDVRVCLKRSGGWNCGVKWGLDPDDSWSHSTFQYEGEWFVSAKDAGSNIRLEQPDS